MLRLKASAFLFLLSPRKTIFFFQHDALPRERDQSDTWDSLVEPVLHAGMWKSQLEWRKQRECRNVSGDSKNIPNFGIFFQCLKKLQFCRRLASYLEICLITEYRILKKIHRPVFQLDRQTFWERSLTKFRKI